MQHRAPDCAAHDRHETRGVSVSGLVDPCNLDQAIGVAVAWPNPPDRPGRIRDRGLLSGKYLLALMVFFCRDPRQRTPREARGIPFRGIILPQIEKVRPAIGARRRQCRQDQHFDRPRAGDVRKPLVLLCAVLVVDADGILDRWRNDIAQHPVQRVVLAAVDKRLARSEFRSHVDRNGSAIRGPWHCGP